jgi:ATP adenylyltransferase
MHHPLSAAELRARAAAVGARARSLGVLEPIATRLEVVEQGGVRFQLRVLDSIRRRERVTAQQRERAARGAPSDPFGPCDPDLLLGDLGATHRCVLNKFPAFPDHLLIVTRDFEHQERLLTAADWGALWTAMAGMDGLAFYNGGPTAGASQPHKHLQLLPLPLAEGEPPLPIAASFHRASWRDGVGRVAGLPFEHALARLPLGLETDPRQAALASLGWYHRLLAAVGLPRRPGQPHQPGPYNLLLTRRWMLVIPRTHEDWQGCSVNALGFAGSLLARDEQERARIRAAGPMSLLSHTGRAWSSSAGDGPEDPSRIG